LDVDQARDTREKFRLLSLYQRFESVVMFLTASIAVIVVAAWAKTSFG
jgi:hypothetical protein